MSAVVRLACDCAYGNCGEVVFIPAQTTSAARCDAKELGWDCDSIGGTTVDWAPGHQIATTHDLKAENR